MWKIKFVVLFIFGLTHAKDAPLINTKLGVIRGLQAEDGDYSMYLGIPYADIDENNPFTDATPHPPFRNVYDAYSDKAKCPQQDEVTKKIDGDFGCLRLNIYVPNNPNTNESLSVMVWIHGGRFLQGDASRFLYGPKFLMRHNIIFITFNYRLGPYGFLCLDTPNAPGNQGMKDQVLALRWIKKHIKDFGGDPNKITVMGESVGAALVELHLMSKFEKLFDAAIVQSGSVFASDTMLSLEENKKITFELIEKLGFKSDNVDDIVSFLSRTEPHKVIDAYFEANLQYGVCVEKQFQNVTSAITEHPDYLSISKDKIVPILGGFNNREDLVTYTDHIEEFLAPTFIDSYLKLLFHVDDEMVDIVHRYYLGDEEISPAVKYNLIDLSSDYRRNYPTQKSILQYFKQGAPKVYQYLFSFSGTRSYVKNNFNVTDEGAGHADELSYFFDLSYNKYATPEDQLIIDRMTKLWTNFVKYGDPTPETSELLPVKWLPMTKKNLYYLNIDLEMALKKRPFHSRLAFWDVFFKAFETKKLSYKGPNKLL